MLLKLAERKQAAHTQAGLRLQAADKSEPDTVAAGIEAADTEAEVAGKPAADRQAVPVGAEPLAGVQVQQLRARVLPVQRVFRS